jgi:Ca-activated chloride channel family protein
MKQNPISPDDPRLTAYALNEMAPEDRAAFASALAQDAAAQQAVEQIRLTGAMLTDALQHESAQPAVATAQSASSRAPTAKIIRFPYGMVSSLAAACFAVAFIYWQRNQLPLTQSAAHEAPLGAAVAAKDAKKDKATEGKEAEVAISFAVAPSPEVAVPSQPNYPAPVAMAPPPPVEVTAQLDRMRVAEYRVASETAKVAGGAMGKARAEQMQNAMAEKTIFANQPTVAAGQLGTEAYTYQRDNGFMAVSQNPLSTFAVDVDTASYANVRRMLRQGQRPPADAVRIEEMVNYFPYGYGGPDSASPIAANLEVASAPWAPEHRLVRIGLRGQDMPEGARPAANLVFLLDVSGSMNQPNKLPLLKQSLRLLVEKLRAEDRVAIAVYAGASGLALPSTSAAQKADILEAIDRLQAEGSTNGALGIQLAYDVAKANFIRGGINRVILATDGDFNVGTTSEGELVRLIEDKAKRGVYLTVLGFGMGNLKDSTLEQLADKGNGNYAYIDSLAEARKVLVEQAGSTLQTIAKDVKVQVEFNPLEVQAYRLIGYENRVLAKEDFNNDQVDAGEIGSGHTVTALYEIVPTGVERPDTSGVDALKYQRPAGPSESRSSLLAGRDLSGPAARQTEMLTVKIRYKEPAGEVSRKLEFPLRDTGRAYAAASLDFRFAAAVAAFGMVLRDSPHKGTSTLGLVEAWGRDSIGNDAGGYRNEFLELVGRAQVLVH